jgi:hypothetical protein
MPTTLAFFPLPEDLDDDFFGVPVLSWSAPDATPPSPESPSAPPDAEP